MKSSSANFSFLTNFFAQSILARFAVGPLREPGKPAEWLEKERSPWNAREVSSIEIHFLRRRDASVLQLHYRLSRGSHLGDHHALYNQALDRPSRCRPLTILRSFRSIVTRVASFRAFFLPSNRWRTARFADALPPFESLSPSILPGDWQHALSSHEIRRLLERSFFFQQAHSPLTAALHRDDKFMPLPRIREKVQPQNCN